MKLPSFACVSAALLAAGSGALALTATATAAPTITEYSSGLSNSAAPLGITPAPDGKLWFTESGNALGSITTAGSIALGERRAPRPTGGHQGL